MSLLIVLDPHVIVSNRLPCGLEFDCVSDISTNSNGKPKIPGVGNNVGGYILAGADMRGIRSKQKESKKLVSGDACKLTCIGIATNIRSRETRVDSQTNNPSLRIKVGNLKWSSFCSIQSLLAASLAQNTVGSSSSSSSGTSSSSNSSGLQLVELYDDEGTLQLILCIRIESFPLIFNSQQSSSSASTVPSGSSSNGGSSGSNNSSNNNFNTTNAVGAVTSDTKDTSITGITPTITSNIAGADVYSTVVISVYCQSAMVDRTGLKLSLSSMYQTKEIIRNSFSTDHLLDHDLAQYNHCPVTAENKDERV